MTHGKRKACRPLLAVTAVAEAGTGVALLFAPAVPLRLLLGTQAPGPDFALTARIAGAALLAIGVICWLARGDDGGAGRTVVPVGILVYDITAAGLLAYGGLTLGMNGIALWPAVALHAAMAVWCAACLRPRWRG